MTDSMTDWRLFGAPDQLKDAMLWWRAYAPRNQIMAQDHCAFCWATFARSGENVWHEGYATQPPYGAGGHAPLPAGDAVEGAEGDAGAEDDDYITQVIAAVSAGGPTNATAAAPADALDPTDTPDNALPPEADALGDLSLPAVPAEPPKVEPVYWICPQCFDDFQGLFGWTVANAE